MCAKFITKLICITILIYLPIVQAESDPQSDAEQLLYVSSTDPTVIGVANFATQAINNGSLFKILSAQKHGTDDVTYVLTLELVDIHRKHHNYVAEVLIPADQAPWQMKYFSPLNY